MEPYLACHTERDLKLMEPDLDISICYQNILSQKMQISPKNSQKILTFFSIFFKKQPFFQKQRWIQRFWKRKEACTSKLILTIMERLIKMLQNGKKTDIFSIISENLQSFIRKPYLNLKVA